MTCGVYEIVAPSGNRYVGSSVRMSERRSQHFSRLRKGRHHSRALQAAWNKYGNRLEFRPLLICSPELRLCYEQRAIDVLRPAYNGLTTAKCGGKPGHVPSLELRQKLSAIHKGKRMGGALSKPWLGKKMSLEHRAKLSEAHRGLPGPRLGKSLNADARIRISLKLKDRVRPMAARMKQMATYVRRHARARIAEVGALDYEVVS